ncbi:major facilitator superfamily domain-containing protein [Coniochaeta sp. 2T2.1]|nr:major facilitator superfamily domain-containing protein [Coniochaeta sp. 2T2.1]
MASTATATEPDDKKAVAVRDAAFADRAADKAPTSGSDTVSVRESAAAGSDGAVQSPWENLNGLPFSKSRCIALVAAVTGASFMNTLSIQAVVIILPTIGRDLNIPETRVQWIVSAYTLTFGCFLMLWGRIGDIYGKRKVFIIGSLWVAATTACNPFIPNEIGFDIFRALQGMGAAANVPSALGILGTTFPPGKAKNYAFSTYAAGAPLGSIFGNILAGFIAAHTSWKWVFGVMAIMAAAVSFAAIAVIPVPKHTLHDEGVTVKNSVDWIGALLITVGLFALLFALTEGNIVGWSTPWVPVVIVLSLILITLFVFWQRHLEKKGGLPPLLKVSVFKSGKFSAAMVIMALFFSSFNGFLIYSTFYYQDFQGLSALQTTLRYIPTGVTGIITAFVASQLISRVPTYLILLFGNLCVSISCLLFAVPIPPTTSYFAYGLPAMILSVFGADTTWPCMTLFTSHALPQRDQALGGALVNSMGQVGRSIALAIATAIQTAVMAGKRGVSVQDAGPLVAWEEATWLGIRAANWFHFGLGVLSMVVSVSAFRGAGIVGRAGVEEQKSDVEGEVRREEKGKVGGATGLGETMHGEGSAGRTEKNVVVEGSRQRVVASKELAI